MKSFKQICFSWFFFTLFAFSANAQRWYNLGAGVSISTGAVVYTITPDTAHKLLYVGGDFNIAGSDTARYIASWNGSVLDSVGKGMNNKVQVTIFYNDTLYAGGDFTRAGNTNVNFISRLAGIKWDSVRSGVNGPVYAMAVFNGKLYVGGGFTKAGGKNARRIATWNGIKWDSVGNGFND